MTTACSVLRCLQLDGTREEMAFGIVRLRRSLALQAALPTGDDLRRMGAEGFEPPTPWV